jgi:hypothetical protein
MKAWKIVTIVALALIAVALATASASAHIGGQGFYNSYGTYTNGGMMGGGMNSGYSYGYPQYPTQPNAPATTPAYPYQYGGCCMRSGWNV